MVIQLFRAVVDPPLLGELARALLPASLGRPAVECTTRSGAPGELVVAQAAPGAQGIRTWHGSSCPEAFTAPLSGLGRSAACFGCTHRSVGWPNAWVFMPYQTGLFQTDRDVQQIRQLSLGLGSKRRSGSLHFWRLPLCPLDPKA